MSVLLHVVVILVLHQNLVDGYINGAPDWACGQGAQMMPYHSNYMEAATQIPYTMTASQTSYNTGDTITLTLSANADNAGTTFKGLFIQAETGTSQVVGEMRASTSVVHTVDCPGNDGTGPEAITHSSNSTKSSVNFQWIAPNALVGDVTFQATVVQNYATFWVRKPLLVLPQPLTPTTSEPSTNAPEALTSAAVSSSSSLPITTHPSTQVTTKVTDQTTTTTEAVTDTVTTLPTAKTSIRVTNPTTTATRVTNPTSEAARVTNPTTEATRVTNPTTEATRVTNPTTGATRVTSPTTRVTILSTNAATQPQTVKNGKIAYDPTCGVSKGCFVDCDSADDCSFMVTWQAGGASIRFELYGKPNPAFTDAWIAVGFSTDTMMGDDSVTECVYSNNQIQAFNSFNTNYSNRRSNAPQLGLSNVQGYYANGVLYCTFVRILAAPSLPALYNLNQDWHMMFAKGMATQVPAWSISMHSVTPSVSASVIDYQSFTVSGRRPVLTPSNGNIAYDSECGSSKGCFVECSGDNCEYMVTWQDLKTGVVRFELYGKPNPGFSDVYISVGVSGNTNMGDTSVTECVYSNGNIQAFNSVNEGRSNRRLNNIGLSNVYGSYANGVMFCSFDRQNTVPSVPELKSLDEDWHIMYAKGEASGWSIRKHLDLPVTSSAKVDYQSFAVIGGGVKFPLVKAHGCLMILAWVLFTGIGIVAARYYKNVWSEKKFLKLHIWFHIHRSCMVTALVLDVIAFIIIFIEVDGYSDIPDIPGKSYLRSHPVLGIIVTALCLTNPIMAIFRGSPATSKRTVFNWAHWAVGISAYILSAICICFGFQLGKSSTPDYAIYIMIAYVLYIILFDVVFEVLEYMSKNQKKSKVEGVEMTARNGSENGNAVGIPNGNNNKSTDTQRKNDKVKTILLVTHIAFTGAFALVLVLVVALN